MTDLIRILLVDDDQVDRSSVRRALSKSGLSHEIVEAVDGRSGLELAREGRFDCVLLDYRLPDVDTFDLMGMLISPDFGEQSVLILTGESDQDLAFRLMRAGALDYMSKAEVTPSGLARAIRFATARRDTLDELKTARREAEDKSQMLDRLNRQKTLLFSIIAHDLRNPFQVLLGLSDTLVKGLKDRDQAFIERRALGLREAAETAHTLMESLFSWATLQMDRTVVELADVDLETAAGAVMETVEASAAAKVIALRARCEGVEVKAQSDMLATVLRNLVVNGVKFTPTGGSVEISAERKANEVLISVTDTGIGMPPERLATLFDLGSRTSTRGTADESGSGIGLILCRELVERMGSELHVTSTLGEGTVFSFGLAAA